MKTYSVREEQLNVATHLFGWIVSIPALVLLAMRAWSDPLTLRFWGFVLFGISLMLQYAASTLYHGAVDPAKRSRLRIFDHSAIYVLIAGSYTPFALVTLAGSVGNTLLLAAWGIALAGIAIKMFFTGRFKVLSTLLYVGMGWMIVFAAKPLYTNLPAPALLWLLAGGLCYTVGAVLYSLKRIPYGHAIFHFFVLAGSFCHYICIYYWV